MYDVVSEHTHARTCKHTHTTALSRHKLEPEFLLSVDESADFDLRSAKVKGYHMEKITKKPSFTASVLEGFTKAHFTVMAVSEYKRCQIKNLLIMLGKKCQPFFDTSTNSLLAMANPPNTMT